MVPFSAMDDVVLVVKKIGCHSHDVFFKINGVDHCDPYKGHLMWGCGNEGNEVGEAIGKACAIAFECKSKPVQIEYREYI